MVSLAPYSPPRFLSHVRYLHKSSFQRYSHQHRQQKAENPNDTNSCGSLGLIKRNNKEKQSQKDCDQIMQLGTEQTWHDITRLCKLC